jgi:toxin-antitoxin system PIN domain toxin
MPDVNVLVYAINPDALQHVSARRWLEAGFHDPQGVGYAWFALAGFVRVTTKRGILPKVLSVEEALRFVDEWLSHPRAHVLNPAGSHAAIFGRLLIGAGRGGNLVSDAHLAAIAIEHGAILGTFDRDFERFAGLRMEWLQAGAVHEDTPAHFKGSVLRFDDPRSPVGESGQANRRSHRVQRKRHS